MSWFNDLTGFEERSYLDTQSKFTIDAGRLNSLVNGRSWAIGEFEMASLSDLKRRAERAHTRDGKAAVRIIQGDVRKLHTAPEYAGALFQVASQFNALEMIGPEISPEDGITRYQNDRTQGPACAMAAGPATVFRNYFVPVDGRVGQTRDRQLNSLSSLGSVLSTALNVSVADLWTMKNGYALCSRDGLKTISDYLSGLDAEQLNELRGQVAIGIQRGVEVTEPGAPWGHLVSQAFCSALPVAYTSIPSVHWRAFAIFILEGAYEATLWEAVLNAAAGGSNTVLLTLVGGGAFGNETEWIFAAIRNSLERIGAHQLDIRIVTFAPPPRELLDFAASL